MQIRFYNSTDLQEIQTIHKRHYESEFPMPDLNDPKFISRFVVVDDFGKVILFGGEKLLLEAIAITDLCRPKKERYEALLKLLQASIFTAAGPPFNFDQLHCTVINNNGWADQLKKYNFKDCRGNFLVLNLSEGR